MSDEELYDGIGQEFLDAVHSKDHKKMLEAIKALITCIQMEDEKQDEESDK